MTVPVLVISCDRYADLWRPFFTIFFRQWPECPYPVHLGTNHKRYDDHRVRTIAIGDDLSWASGVVSMLDALESEHVIVFLEDFFIMQPVDGAAIERFVSIAQQTGAGCIRLSPLPPPSAVPTRKVDAHPELGVVEPGTPYRVSAQPAIWRTDVLRRLLVPGFSPWQFEVLGTQMSDYFTEPFWGPFEPTVVYDHVVEKGKWKPAGLRIARELGIEPDLAVRPAFSESEFTTHLESGRGANDTYSRFAEAMRAFRSSKRAAGVRAAAAYVREGGSVAQSLAITACGLIGPKPVEALIRWNVNRKVRRVRDAFARKARGA